VLQYFFYTFLHLFTQLNTAVALVNPDGDRRYVRRTSYILRCSIKTFSNILFVPCHSVGSRCVAPVAFSSTARSGTCVCRAGLARRSAGDACAHGAVDGDSRGEQARFRRSAYVVDSSSLVSLSRTQIANATLARTACGKARGATHVETVAAGICTAARAVQLLSSCSHAPRVAKVRAYSYFTVRQYVYVSPFGHVDEIV
jgi:hypothetical protein